MQAGISSGPINRTCVILVQRRTNNLHTIRIEELHHCPSNDFQYLIYTNGQAAFGKP